MSFIKTENQSYAYVNYNINSKISNNFLPKNGYFIKFFKILQKFRQIPVVYCASSGAETVRGGICRAIQRARLSSPNEIPSHPVPKNWRTNRSISNSMSDRPAALPTRKPLFPFLTAASVG